MTNVELIHIRSYNLDGKFYFDLTYRIYKNGKTPVDAVYRKVSNPFSEVSLPEVEFTDEEDTERSNWRVKVTKDLYVFRNNDSFCDTKDSYMREYK